MSRRHELEAALAPGENQAREISKLLHRKTALDKMSERISSVPTFLRHKVLSTVHCRSMANRAALKRCLRVTRSMTAASMTADASSSNGVGSSFPPKISRCSILHQMIALPAHDAIMSSPPAELSASFRGEKHSAMTEPESSKKI